MEHDNLDMDELSITEANLQMDSDINEKKKKSMWIEFIIYIVALIMCAFIIPKYILQRTIIDGPSMESNLLNGENVLVEKISIHFKELQRFDVIVFHPYGNDNPEYYVKRVIGLPGEVIQITNGVILINGNELVENYGKDPINEDGIAAEPIQLAEDEYFVLGDNREVSLDSRSEVVGPVHKSNINGKVILRIWPFSKFGAVN